MMRWWYGNGNGNGITDGSGFANGFGHGFMPFIIMIGLCMLVGAALIVLFVMLFRKHRSERESKEIRNEALEVLKMRFAKGEINEEEFEQRKSALNR